MALPALIALTGVGVVAGFLSGLIGVGGGVLIVPFLYFFYERPAFAGVQIAPALEATIAHATSLFIIVPTAILGTVSYTRANLVAWRAAVPIAVVSVAAAAAGANLALLLPPDALKLTFGVFLLFTAVQLLGVEPPAETGPPRLQLGLMLPIGVAVGLLSAMLGVGGGIVAIPLLIHLVRLDLQRVAATSLAVVALAASAGTATYMWTGWRDPGLPAGSLGYVHAAAAIPILIGSVITVRLGTKVNQRVDRRTLRRIFGLVFLAVGARLIMISLPRL